MGDPSDFDGKPTPAADPNELRLDAAHKPRTRLGFPTPPATPGMEAFPADEVTRRTPVPAQLVQALQTPTPKKARVDVTQPFAADMPLPPPPPASKVSQTLRPGTTAPVSRPPSPAGSTPTTKPPVPPPAAQSSARPAAPPSSGGPRLNLDTSDFGRPQAARNPSSGPSSVRTTPPSSSEPRLSLERHDADRGASVPAARDDGGPRLRLGEAASTPATPSHTASSGAEAGGPRLELGMMDRSESRRSARKGGLGRLLFLTALMLALVGGAAFAFQQFSAGPDRVEPTAASTADLPQTSSTPAPAAPNSEGMTPAGEDAKTPQDSVAAAAEPPSTEAKLADEPQAKPKPAPKAATAKARQTTTSPRKKVAAKKPRTSPEKAPASDRATGDEAGADPETSASLEEARAALKSLGDTGDEEVLEVRPSEDEDPADEEASGSDLLPPPPPPPPAFDDPPSP